ncbi:glycosyltransferase family 2 protein [Chitinivibrio alkaliphilus]|uniref:Glycosyltransferase-like protein, family 2 n=1 Tax=Chitinivibrio alkaliphilus ACht1 TaxID=1313304 RepID=U7DBI2_9BACT|nr:glycosyltransferase family A protein [Chitinivibrio alkaliphilus]ERP31785.1 glycosyltransferase-like protein, family 2 [Chitinivibrio alkaliphilus ACht1]
MRPVFSVVIPTYNRYEQCVRALSSVIAQDFPFWEVILVDDGSTMAIPEAFRRLLSQHSEKITLLSFPENRGVSAARNAGIARARGEWVAFLDSDDVWHREKLTRQYEKCQSQGYLIHQTREIWIRRGVRVNPPRKCEKYEGDLFADSLERCIVTPSSVVIHGSLFTRFGLFNESFPACEDYDLWIRMTAQLPVGLVDAYLLTRYGGHADQLSITVPVQDRYRVEALQALLETGGLSLYQQELVRRVLRKKAEILLLGAQKRGLHEEERYYAGILTEK